MTLTRWGMTKYRLRAWRTMLIIGFERMAAQDSGNYRRAEVLGDAIERAYVDLREVSQRQQP